MRYGTLVAALTLASCQQQQQQQEDSRICETPAPFVTTGEWEKCVHRLAYMLARAPDPAEVVARTVVTECADTIALRVNKVASLPPERRADLASSMMRAARRQALFRVLQARAGHCNVPQEWKEPAPQTDPQARQGTRKR